MSIAGVNIRRISNGWLIVPDDPRVMQAARLGFPVQVDVFQAASLGDAIRIAHDLLYDPDSLKEEDERIETAIPEPFLEEAAQPPSIDGSAFLF